MKPNDDITNFWLAWREICSIRLCMDAGVVRTKCKDIPAVSGEAEKVVEQARDVVETTNWYFAGMIRTPRSVKALKKFAVQTGKDVSECPDQNREEELEAQAERDVPLSNETETRSDSGTHLVEGPSLGSITENPDNVVPAYVGPSQSKRPSLPRGKMVSEYRDLIARWYEKDMAATSAFELVEIDLYREAAEKSEATGLPDNKEPMLNGKKLKDYLFEDIGGRPGGLCQNLWGYLLKKEASCWGISRLRMVANTSFKNPLLEKNTTKNDQEPAEDIHDTNSVSSEESAAVKEVGESFRRYLSERWTVSFDVTDRVVLCCAFFRYVLSDSFVESLVPIAKSALNARKTKRVSEVFMFLKDAGFEFDDVRAMFCDMGQKILADFASSDPVCMNLMEHFEKK